MSVAVSHFKSILRLNRLKERTGISRSSIYNKLNPKSKYYDQTFPKPIRLGVGSVGWIESDVEIWLNSRPRARNGHGPI